MKKKIYLFPLGLLLFIGCTQKPTSKKVRTKLLLGFEHGMSHSEVENQYNLLVKKNVIQDETYYWFESYNNGTYVMQAYQDKNDIKGRIEIKYENERLEKILLHIPHDGNDYNHAMVLRRLRNLLSTKYDYKGDYPYITNITNAVWEKDKLMVIIMIIQGSKSILIYTEKGEKELENINMF